MTFFDFLNAQTARADLVGQFCLHASKDPQWPRRTWKLYLLLRYVDDAHRDGLKATHREWRRTQ